MKQLTVVILFCLLSLVSFSQNFDLQGLKDRLNNTTNDTLRLVQLDSLNIGYSEINPDSSIHYAEMEIEIAKLLDFKLNEAAALNMQAYALLNLGNYPASLQIFLAGIEIANNATNEKKILPERYRRTFGIKSDEISPRSYRLQILAFLYFNFGILYENAGNTEKALSNYFQAHELGELTANKQIIGGTYMNIGRIYLQIKKNDSALYFQEGAYDTFREIGMYEYMGSSLLNLGRVYLANGNEAKAVSYFHEAIKVSTEQKYMRGVTAANLVLADINIKNKNKDSAFIFIQNALQIANTMNAPDLLLRTYNSTSNYYKSLNNNDSVVKYLSLVIRMKDSLFNSKQSRQFQNIDFNYLQQQQELAAAKKDYKDKVMKYVLLFGLAVFFIIAIILWRNYHNKQKAYKLLTKQKQETDQQKSRVEHTLDELKRTQAQLIQKEKMASLGELTVGIAHEIQNPLNFVNNFSEVNNELIEETKSEIEKGNIKDAQVLLKDIKDNEEKIIHHGKRAGAIVKSMLQHSGASSGQMEYTDINTLCEEYLRLSFSSFQRKDKSFNAKFETDFDSTIPKLNVVPQDIGRVLLNLNNNAFYAVSEKAKQNISGYTPTVTISTKRINGKLEISVADNGNGIPETAKEKIFQPFFTTKPTGQGTGLGLSLSYDIVKAHGGELTMETKEGEGTEFRIII